MKIYLAGPLFTTAERNFNAQLAALLRKNHEVCLPQEAEQEDMSPREVFDKDVNGLDQAQVIVANMDGPDPDSGTCWECGYAYAMKKLGKKNLGKEKWIILFRTDFRAMFEIGKDLRPGKERDKAPYNPMLTESADIRIDLPQASVAAVAERIEKALNQLPPRARQTGGAGKKRARATSTSAGRRGSSRPSRGTKRP